MAEDISIKAQSFLQTPKQVKKINANAKILETIRE